MARFRAHLAAPITTIRRLRHDFSSYDPAIPRFWIPYLLTNFGIGVWAIALNLFLFEHGFRADLIGAITSFYTFGAAAIAIPASKLLEKLGDQRSFVIAAGGLAFALIGQALFPTTVTELALSFAGGGAASLLAIATVPYLSKRVEREKRSSLFATNFVVQALALMLGSLLGGYLPAFLIAVAPEAVSRATAYAIALIVGGLVTASSIPFFLRLPQGEPAEPVEARRTVATITVAAHPIVTRGAEPFGGWGPVIFAATGGVMAIAYGINGPFFNIYLGTQLQASPAEIGTIFFLSSLIAIPATMFGPLLARYTGLGTAIAIGRWIAVPFLALIPLLPVTWIAGLAFILRNASASVAWPLELAFWTDRLPPREQSRALAYRTTATNLTWGLAGMVGGQIVVLTGSYSPVFLVGAFLLAIIGSVYAFVLGRHAAPVPAPPRGGVLTLATWG